MTQNNVDEFKFACKEFLFGLSINALRSYGRDIGVSVPTKRNKAELIQNIVAILVGELSPTPLATKGAPVKDGFVDPKIHEQIKKFRTLYSMSTEAAREDPYDIEARLKNVKENERMLTVEDPNARELEINGVREIFKGQLETLNGVSMLLPLNCIDSVNKIIVSVEMIRAFDLREGDVITCYAEKRSSILVATTILTVNELVAESFHRGHFDDYSACYPQRRIHFYDGKKYSSLTEKCLEWLIPIGKGQRALVVSAPKAGKSTFLLEAAKSAAKLNKGMKVLTLLVDQSPENIGQFRKFIDAENLVYTTYEDEPERQIFAAEFILKRAKRCAECGMDVLLIVDSLNALAHAYNDTEASVGGKVLAGGLESKTVQYLKRYFGTARCLERGGSVTILGAIVSDTGNPVDDILKAELSAIGNLEIYLCGELAKRRVYPAVDILATQGKRSGMLWGSREDNFDVFMRNEYLSEFGTEDLLGLVAGCSSFEEVEEKAYKRVKGKKK